MVSLALSGGGFRAAVGYRPVSEASLESVLADLSRWRREALRRAVTPRPAEQAELVRLHQRIAELEAELSAQRNTLSWRITRPLRAARRLAR
jgi:hypothetical protein